VYGSVAGTVTDSSGARIPEARLTITSLERKTIDTATSAGDIAPIDSPIAKISKFGSLGLLAFGSMGLDAWRGANLNMAALAIVSALHAPVFSNASIAASISLIIAWSSR
jgi:Zn-dependent M28 family amino/carboxypeptidase